MTDTTLPGQAAPKTRFYLDDGERNPRVNTKALRMYLQALFGHWVKSHRHAYDFVHAAEHAATDLYLDHKLGAFADFSKEGILPEFTLPPPHLAPTAEDLAKPPRRYISDEGSSEGTNLDPYCNVLRPVFVHWLVAGVHARDFIQATRDEASAVYDHYETCLAMNGLGGCESPADYLEGPPEL